MKPELILHADLLDIVFENRNKDYGAYVLRKQYPAELQKASLIVLFCVAVTSVLFFYTRVETDTFTVTNPTGVEVVILPPPPPAVPDVPPPPPAAIEHVTGIISASGTDTMPTIDALSQAVQIGTTNQAGDSSDVAGPVPLLAETSGNTSEVPVQEVAPAIYHTVQEMPEFPGGTAALQRFLLKHLRVPDEGLEPGNRVTVRVQFIVDKNGSITGMEILKTGGEVFNKEVLRVLNKMPAWKPGRQNGIQVPVYYQLPVTFETHE